MRRIILFTIALTLTILSISAQVNKKSLRSHLDSMFEHLDKSSVPYGLLRDYAIEDEDLEKFTGDNPLSSENIGTLTRYAHLLSTISSASLKEKIDLDISRRFHNTKKHSNNIRISLIAYKYSEIRPDALTSNLIVYRGGKVYNNPKTNESPYKISTVFAACALDPTSEHTRTTISFPKDLLFSNQSISKIEIDFGNGFVLTRLGDNIPVNLSPGDNDIKIKASFVNGETLLAHTVVKVSPRQNLRAIRNQINPEVQFRTKGDSFHGVSTEADVSIKYIPGNHSITKPLIIVEGFDPRINLFGPQGAWNIQNLGPLEQFKELNKTYDLVYVDWVNSEEYIQANAETLKKVILRINDSKSLNAGGEKEKSIILAHSMGGLVARYALKTMEQAGVKHQVSTYISYDVPHLGAHVPLGILYGFHGVKEFLHSRGIVEDIIYKFTDFKEYIELGNAISGSTAAQQMLTYFVDANGNFNNQEHIAWQTEINKLGFPNGDKGEDFRMLAVANSGYHPVEIPKSFLSIDLAARSGYVTDIIGIIPYARKVLATVVGVALNDIIAGVLALLPGSTKITGNIDLLPARYGGDIITDINLSYTKRFLWLVPITHDIFGYTRHFPTYEHVFDTYPGSTFGLGNLSTFLHEECIMFFDLQIGLKTSSSIQFIPTSSALSAGDGLTDRREIFTNSPMGETPFGWNYYLHEGNLSHTYFTENGIDWIRGQLSTAIIGPKVGYNGAKYKLSNTHSNESNISWSSSDTSIAEISSDGVLSAKGKGCVTIIAKMNGVPMCSKIIIVGSPKFILRASHNPGGYKVVIEPIEDGYSAIRGRFSSFLDLRWGVHRKNKDISWSSFSSDSIQIATQESMDQITVFLKDLQENQVYHVSISPQSIYSAKDRGFILDENGNLYKENNSPYRYSSARLYISYSPGVLDMYKSRAWMPITGEIISPSGNIYTASYKTGGILVKEIIPPSEVKWIISNHQVGDKITYLIILKNFEKKTIQYIPISFTLK